MNKRFFVVAQLLYSVREMLCCCARGETSSWARFFEVRPRGREGGRMGPRVSGCLHLAVFTFFLFFFFFWFFFLLLSKLLGLSRSNEEPTRRSTTKTERFVLLGAWPGRAAACWEPLGRGYPVQDWRIDESVGGGKTSTPFRVIYYFIITPFRSLRQV